MGPQAGNEMPTGPQCRTDDGSTKLAASLFRQSSVFDDFVESTVDEKPTHRWDREPETPRLCQAQEPTVATTDPQHARRRRLGDDSTHQQSPKFNPSQTPRQIAEPSPEGRRHRSSWQVDDKSPAKRPPHEGGAHTRTAGTTEAP
ncbi:hypothetical protein CSOJ01_07267 [Colletotrichum sojae]|uniref:Uncharacterized protein n=1 Tax=Colletotrichum sojae TaxID=2175907 RepID=A0A8H6JAC1_9PEZI|nr:hypothetical protein CSOJ01_07267 [Colletotrichum sojae]